MLTSVPLQCRRTLKRRWKKDFRRRKYWARLRAFPFISAVLLDINSFPSAVTFAATDTTSNTISRILCLLADHKDIQLRLRTEIREARRANHDHDLEYEELLALPLLDAVVKETLRVFPPVTNLSRMCVYSHI